MTPTTYVYKTVAGCEIRADVYRAPNRAGRSPAIFWIHGGALISGGRDSIHPEQLTRYLRGGYGVVSIDYRLAPETKLPSIIEDLRDAWKWVSRTGAESFGIDSRRIAAVGHSAGGYLTLMAGFCVRPRPKALVSFYGYGDITGDWYAKPDPYYCRQPPVSREEALAAVGDSPVSDVSGLPDERWRFYLHCRQQGAWIREVAGRDLAGSASALDAFRPARNLSPEYPPTLLLHGEKDTDVPCAESAGMARALSAAGVENALITIRDGGHGFDHATDDPAVREALEKVMAFLDRHLAPFR